MSVESERESLVAALRFYANSDNWDSCRVPEELVPEHERLVMVVNGEEHVCETWMTGPALDGGAHAREVLKMLEKGERAMTAGSRAAFGVGNFWHDLSLSTTTLNSHP